MNVTNARSHTETKTFSSFQKIRRTAQIAAWLGMCSLVGVVQGQEDIYSKYEQLPVNERYQMESLAPQLVDTVFVERSETEKKEITNRNRTKRAAVAEDKRRVETILETNGDLNDPVVAQFFGGYIFPEMTQLGDRTYDKLSNLGNLRAEFLKSYLSPKVTGQNRQRFIDTICIPKLKEIYANTNFHPAARLSAVYLLGMLDTSTGSRSPAIAPTPSPAAFDELLVIMESGELEPFLKVGAWASLQRHIEIDSAVGNQIADAKKIQLKDMASQILSDSFPGQANWEADLAYWMKRRSTQMLGLSKDPAMLTPVVNTLNNSANRFWLRMDALEAIEKLAPSQVDAKLIETVGTYLADSIAEEAKWLEDEKQTLINDNLLFQDVDLEVTGTDWSSDVQSSSGGGQGSPATGRGGSPGGGLGLSGGGELGIGGGEMTGGAGGALPGAGNRGGGSRFGGGVNPGAAPGSGATPEATETKFVELPNYLLNVSRRRIKTLAFVGKRVLKPAENRGLHSVADAESKSKVNRMVTTLDKLLTDSNVGIVNLDARRTRRGNTLEEETAPKESVTAQMAEMCKKASEQLKSILKPAEAAQNPLGS